MQLAVARTHQDKASNTMLHMLVESTALNNTIGLARKHHHASTM
jgi:hypothetical protein